MGRVKDECSDLWQSYLEGSITYKEFHEECTRRIRESEEKQLTFSFDGGRTLTVSE